MATLHRVRVAWSGWPGGPGVSTFYFDPASAPPLAALKTLYTSVAGICATGIVFTFENAGQDVDVSTGQAVGSWTAPSVTNAIGSGSTAYAGPAGGMISWRSGVFLGGRQIVGKTFLVPLGSNAYDTDGSVGNATVNAMNTALSTFLSSAGSLRLWSRKNQAAVSVASAVMVDKAVVMRSRRA